MKKILLTILIFCMLSVSASAAEYYKSGSTYYKFDFNSESSPEYSALSGEWGILKAERENELLFDFEDNADGFEVMSGVWSVTEGEYLQSEENPAATSRAVTKEKYKDFSLEFSLKPKSEENTVMIYFGYENEGKYNSIEINSYQSNLLFNGESITGKGSIVKDEEYKIRFTCIDKRVTLYCNSQVIFDKEDVEFPEGRVGIGSWNSSMSFDDFCLYGIGENGADNSLFTSAKDSSIALFKDISRDNLSVTVPITIKNVNSGTGGILLRSDYEGRGYYFGIDKNSLYIKKENKILKSCEFKPRSGREYTLTAVCDGDNLILMADGKEMLNVKDSEFSSGICGIFAKKTDVYYKNVDVKLIRKEYPPLISDGNTTYYIDAQNGDDQNDGKSPEKAWKSLDRVYSYTFASGDKILLKKSAVYEGAFVLNNADGVTVESYGEGDAPIITSGDAVMEITGCKNITINGIAVNLRHFDSKDKGYGVIVKASENVTFADCVVSGIGNSNTVAFDTDSEECFNNLKLVNTATENFGANDICINGAEIKKDVIPDQVQKYEQLATKLGLIGLFDDGSFREDAYITNGELEKAVMAIAQKSGETGVMLKYGYAEKELPDGEAALVEDVMYAMVKLLGYPVQDFSKTASEVGLYKGIGLKNEYVTRKSFARILYNTLTAEKLSMGEISDNGLVMKRDGTLLYDVFGVKKITGVAEEDHTAYISTKSGMSLAKDEILIDKICVGGIDDTKRYLGRRIEAYVKFNDDFETTATLLVAEDYKTEVIRATSEFIDGATTSAKLVWADSKSEKIKTEKIPSDAILIYNGVRMGKTAGQEWSLFTPGDGEVNLIDNNGDGDADVVMVWSYIPYVLDYVNMSSLTLFDKTGREPIDLYEKEYKIFDTEGKLIKLEDLKAFDVLSVAFSDDEIVIRRASNAPITGVYNRKGYSIKIDNDEYSLGGWCSVAGLVNGEKVTVYTDIYNRAAYIRKYSEYEYAYLTKLYYDEVEDSITVKMYSFSDKVCKKEFAQNINVSFDGEKNRYSQNKRGDNSFNVLYGLICERNELVKYKINAEGKINELLFPKIKIWQDMPDSESGFDIYYGNVSGISPIGREGKFLQNMFVSRYKITENTKLLSLEGNKNEPEKFREIMLSDMVADNDYYITVYDVNERFEAGAVVVDSVEGWYAKYGSLIEKISTVADEDGETVTEISIYTQGEKKIIKADNPDIVCNGWVAQRFENSGTKISDLKVGDVIYYNLDNRGYIASFAVLHKNVASGEFYRRSSYGWEGNYIPNAAMATAYCKVIKTYSDMIVLDIDGARPIGEYQWRNYYLYKNNRITKVDFSEIKPGDRVVGLWKWSNMNDLIIYR